MATHGHDHAPANFGNAFAIGITLNVGFVVAEVVFGFIANSMSLLADAGHNLSDVLGLVLAWAAAMMARRAASPRFTYGLKKAPILAALANSLILVIAVGAIGGEAIRRLFHPSIAQGGIVTMVAAAGIVVNGLTALLFASGRRSDINIGAAYLHMAGDALVSVAVVILWSSIDLLKESMWMSLAGVPKGIDVDEVALTLAAIEGVEAVHDLHIWPVSTTETALTAHIVTARADYPDALLESARTLLHDRFHIEHCTIQVESHHPAHHCDC
jgi:cobalt-zinc-cadmium efflux system protein